MKKQAITLLLILLGFTTAFAQTYPEMITVEGGTFTMGDSEMEGDASKQPTQTETTLAQWKAYCSRAGK